MVAVGADELWELWAEELASGTVTAAAVLMDKPATTKAAVRASGRGSLSDARVTLTIPSFSPLGADRHLD